MCECASPLRLKVHNKPESRFTSSTYCSLSAFQKRLHNASLFGVISFFARTYHGITFRQTSLDFEPIVHP
jgi:hypothetical protein